MEDSILVGNLDEIVNFSLQDIVQPIDQLGPYSSFFQSHVQYLPQTLHRIMAGNAPPNSNQPLNPNPPPS